MGGIFTVRITESAGEIHDLRYRFIWSAWLDGTKFCRLDSACLLHNG